MSTKRLPESLQPHVELLDDIAEAWLRSGAAHVAIWGEGQVYANWANQPHEISQNQPTYTQISASIVVNEEILGHLYVFGQNDRLSKKRLNLDAKLISLSISQTSPVFALNGSDQTVPMAAHLSQEYEALKEEIMISEDRADRAEIALIQVSKQLDALVRLSQFSYEGHSTEEWLNYFRKTVFNLVPVEQVFTLTDSGEDSFVLDSHPIKLKDAEMLVYYLQDMEAIDMECVLNEASALDGIPDHITNILYTPIFSNSEYRIRLGLVNRAETDFAEGDVNLVRLIASQAQKQISSIMNKEEEMEEVKLRAEMEMAFEVQNQLLPERPPDVKGLDIFAYSRPAMHVGGDFYDFHMRDDSRLVFTVGDVSGKGMSSALMMGSTRQILNSKAKDLMINNPRDLLSHALKDLYEDFMRVQMFATVFVGYYDPETQQLVYANAGHSPVIYCSKDGVTQFLEADSPPLGVLSTSLALNHKLQMFPGDTLIVATDGLTEAQNQDEVQFGNDRLLDVVRKVSKDSANYVAKGLFRTIDRFSQDSVQTDDQTLMVLRVK
ncbi:MAG: PP2C family protein-serine/threonine phosphatase [Chloroflexota bacterium]